MPEPAKNVSCEMACAAEHLDAGAGGLGAR